MDTNIWWNYNQLQISFNFFSLKHIFIIQKDTHTQKNDTRRSYFRRMVMDAGINIWIRFANTKVICFINTSVTNVSLSVISCYDHNNQDFILSLSRVLRGYQADERPCSCSPVKTASMFTSKFLATARWSKVMDPSPACSNINSTLCSLNT